MNPQSSQNIITILRNVTGRVDASDPLFTDTIMLQYINNFLSLESTQDIRIFQNKTWWEFAIDPTSPDPYPVDLDALGFSTIEPPAYCDGFFVFWYQSPKDFFSIWPETQTYAPSRPTYALYYNNELIFRNPPDRTYNMKIAAYKVQPVIPDAGNINSEYLFRYTAYGTALDIFSDYGEMDKYASIEPVFRKYRALVYARTNQQYQNQRPDPEF